MEELTTSGLMTISLSIFIISFSVYILVKCVDLAQDIYVSFDHWNKKRIKRKLKLKSELTKVGSH